MADKLKGLEDARRVLEEEYKKLDFELRVELPKEIDTARQLGDLSENSEYKMALERQLFVKARVADIRQRIAALSQINVSSIPKDRAAYGSSLLLLDLDRDEEMSVHLVTQEEADISKGKYSVQSPIGRSLLGKREGDVIDVETPGGKRSFEVLELKTIHED